MKSEGFFSSLAYYGQKNISLLSNSSSISQKHHLSKTYPDVWNRGFVEMKGNEGDKGLRRFWKIGRDVRKEGKVEFQILSEGKGSKRAKHRPSLENFQIVARS